MKIFDELGNQVGEIGSTAGGQCGLILLGVLLLVITYVITTPIGAIFGAIGTIVFTTNSKDFNETQRIVGTILCLGLIAVSLYYSITQPHLWG